MPLWLRLCLLLEGDFFLLELVERLLRERVAGEATVAFNDCRIIENTAGEYGGGAYVDGEATVTFNDCRITSNTAGNGGGGDNVTGGATAILNNCQIIANTAPNVGR